MNLLLKSEVGLKLLLVFPKSEGMRFLSSRSKYMGIFRSPSLNASYFNTEFKLAVRKLRYSEGGKTYKYLIIGEQYQRLTHLWPGFMVKVFRQVTNCKCKGIIFPGNVPNHAIILPTFNPAFSYMIRYSYNNFSTVIYWTISLMNSYKLKAQLCKALLRLHLSISTQTERT